MFFASQRCLLVCCALSAHLIVGRAYVPASAEENSSPFESCLKHQCQGIWLWCCWVCVWGWWCYRCFLTNSIKGRLEGENTHFLPATDNSSSWVQNHILTLKWREHAHTQSGLNSARFAKNRPRKIARSVDCVLCARSHHLRVNNSLFICWFSSSIQREYKTFG